MLAHRKHDKEFSSAITLVCMMQHFLNGARRKAVFQKAWPMGPNVTKDHVRMIVCYRLCSCTQTPTKNKTHKHTCFRGGAGPIYRD